MLCYLYLGVNVANGSRFENRKRGERIGGVWERHAGDSLVKKEWGSQGWGP